MKILTGNTYGKKLEEIRKRDMGIMIASSASFAPSKDWKGLYLTLDNGAFMCHQREYPFMENVFLDTLGKCYKLGLDLQMIVCPDIVAGGLRSLDFSYKWSDRLVGCPNLALVVQNGMEPEDIGERIEPFSWVFLGGSVEWKWTSLVQWVEYTKSFGLKLHVGQVGTKERLDMCKEYGVDSVDSTSFTRNDSWYIVDEHIKGEQLTLL